MAESSSPRVACPACGNKYRWSAELAGRKVACKCGAIMRMPADAAGAVTLERAPEKPAAPAAPAPKPAAPKPAGPVATTDDDYELADPDLAGKPATSNAKPPTKPLPPTPTPHPPATPKAPAAPRPAAGAGRCPSCGQPVKPAAVICVNCGFNLAEGKKLKTDVTADEVDDAGPTKPAAAAKSARKTLKAPPGALGASAVAKSLAAHEDEVKDTKWKDLYLPIALTVLGLGFSFAQHYFFSGDDEGPSLLFAAMQVGIEFVFTVPILFGGIVIASKLLDVGFGSLGQALLKIVAIGFGPGAIGGIVGLLIGDLTGLLVGVLVSVALYWTLVKVLFDLDLGETMITIVIIGVLRNLVVGFLLSYLFGVMG